MVKDKHFALIGRHISYSFSQSYFNEKFRKEGHSGCTYENFDINDIEEFREICTKNLNGLNVTIPYKQSVIPYLDSLSETAAEIGAVNTVKFEGDGKMTGFNTDYFGFQKSIQPLLKKNHKKALILGTGGASKAVAFAFKQMGIGFGFASRNAENGISYGQLNENTFSEFQIVVNCTPIGTFPDTEAFPQIPYHLFTSEHIAYDLIYNPPQTTFLQLAAQQNAVTKNGLDMLIFQAEKAWEIWNS